MVFEREAREFSSFHILHYVTNITHYVSLYTRKVNMTQITLEYTSIRENLTRASRSNTGTKMKATLKLLQRHKERHDKVLLFSSSCQLLDILQQMVISQGYSYNRLDGSTPLHERQTMVKEFNRDTNKFVFLISTKAGGLGPI